MEGTPTRAAQPREGSKRLDSASKARPRVLFKRAYLIIGFCTVLVVLGWTLYPTIAHEGTVQIDDALEPKPVQITIRLKEGLVSSSLRGILESDAQDVLDLEQTARDTFGFGLDLEAVRSQLTLLVGLESIRVRDQLVYSHYPGESLCIRSITIRARSPSGRQFLWVDQSGSTSELEDRIGAALEYKFSEQACPTPFGTILAGQELGAVPLEAFRSVYFYPFDLHWVDLDVSVYATLTDASGESRDILLSPNVVIESASTGWATTASVRDEGTTIAMLDEIQEFKHSIVRLRYERPLTYRILIPSILISLLLTISFLTFVPEIGSFLEVSVAILLGLIGLRDVFVPREMPPTIIDPLMLALYALLVLALLSRLVLIPAWNRAGRKEERAAVMFDAKTPDALSRNSVSAAIGIRPAAKSTRGPAMVVAVIAGFVLAVRVLAARNPRKIRRG